MEYHPRRPVWRFSRLGVQRLFYARENGLSTPGKNRFEKSIFPTDRQAKIALDRHVCPALRVILEQRRSSRLPITTNRRRQTREKDFTGALKHTSANCLAPRAIICRPRPRVQPLTAASTGVSSCRRLISAAGRQLLPYCPTNEIRPNGGRRSKQQNILMGRLRRDGI